MSFFTIRDPRDLRSLSLEDLRLLAEEIRQLIVSVCLKNGGHLGASLGTVELAISLHSVFESPKESIIWDVGHQAYAHKLLTGRWDRFHSLRTAGGVSGFLSREESEHDVFGAGHSSTSLSAALAIAWTKRFKEANEQWTVAVIGDGAMSSGMALEALNNIKDTSAGPLLIVLNDNQMSISENSGALSEIFSGGSANEFFSLFGLDYVGPIDGHDLGMLIGTLQGIRQGFSGNPIVLHVVTQKGKGYLPAEELPATYHGVAPVKAWPRSDTKMIVQPSFSEVAGAILCELAEKDSRVVAITAAMTEGTGLAEFSRRFPERFFDVGIAEQHAVTFAAGLATQGFKPFVFIYSTFLQRALDQVIHDVALQRLSVTFMVDRAGFVGADGPTHHGSFDLAFLGMIPGLRVQTPSSLEDLRALAREALHENGPIAIRYPRGSGPSSLAGELNGKIRVHRFPPTPTAVLVAVGATVTRAEQALKEVDPACEQIGFVSVIESKPIPEALLELLRRFSEADLLIAEDGAILGGFGQRLVYELGTRRGMVSIMAYPDRFFPHGSPAELEVSAGVGKDAMVAKLRELLSAKGSLS